MRNLYRPTLLTDVDEVQPLDLDHPHAAGLVGMWKVLPSMKGGLKLHDLTPNKNDGTLTNLDPATDWVDGRDGLGALDYDGTNDYVTQTWSVGIPCTIMCFGMPRNTANLQYAVAIGSNASEGIIGISFRGNSTGDPVGAIQQQTGGPISGVAAGGNYVANEWLHLCGVFPTNTYRECFKNGESVASDSTNCVGTTPAFLSFGALRRSSVGDYFNAQLDDIRIYNRILYAAEIPDIYEDTLTGRYELLRRVGSRRFFLPIVSRRKSAALWTGVCA